MLAIDIFDHYHCPPLSLTTIKRVDPFQMPSSSSVWFKLLSALKSWPAWISLIVAAQNFLPLSTSILLATSDSFELSGKLTLYSSPLRLLAVKLIIGISVKIVEKQVLSQAKGRQSILLQIEQYFSDSNTRQIHFSFIIPIPLTSTCFCFSSEMSFDLEKALRKSEILTRDIIQVTPHLSLPKIHPQTKQNANPLKSFAYLKSKGRQQILKEQRQKGLFLLNKNLNQLHKYNSQQLLLASAEESDSSQQQLSAKLQKKLTFPMNEPKKKGGLIQDEEVDEDRLEFTNRCSKISQLHQIIDREHNMRFKNKIAQTISRTSSKDSLLKLFQTLSHPNVNLDSLYQRYRRLYLSSKGFFRKDLKFISLSCGNVIDQYEQNRYKHLNDDILRIKCEMKREGASLGRKLHVVENSNLRKGIVSSLKNLDFACVAHRGLYDKIVEIRRKSEL